MFNGEILIIEFGTIDRLSSSSIMICEISTLDHEIRDDSVESTSFIVQRFTVLSYAIFPCAESSEVFYSFWNHFTVKSEDNTACSFSIDGNVKEGFASELKKVVVRLPA